MSKQKVEILFILAEAVPTFPKGMKDYVLRYFESVTFLSLTYFTAVWTVSYDYSKNANAKGAAPKFPENFSHFKEGLSHGETPHAWIQARLADNVQQEIVLKSYAWEGESYEENND